MTKLELTLLENCELSFRIKKILKNAGVKYIEQLEFIDEYDLLCLCGFGRESFYETLSFMHEHNLSFSYRSWKEKNIYRSIKLEDRRCKLLKDLSNGLLYLEGNRAANNVDDISV